MDIRLIVFDLDGVLRSFSWEGVFSAYQGICLELEMDFSRACPDDMERFKGWFSHDWSENFYRMGIDRKHFMPMSRVFHGIYDPYVSIFPWTERILAHHSSLRYLAVQSNNTAISIEGALNGSCRHLSMMIGCDQVDNPKPHPEGLKYIMERLGVLPEETLMVGDTKTDVWTGKNAGTHTAVVSWGATTCRRELCSLEADRIMYDPEDLLAL